MRAGPKRIPGRTGGRPTDGGPVGRTPVGEGRAGRGFDPVSERERRGRILFGAEIRTESVGRKSIRTFYYLLYNRCEAVFGIK